MLIHPFQQALHPLLVLPHPKALGLVEVLREVIVLIPIVSAPGDNAGERSVVPKAAMRLALSGARDLERELAGELLEEALEVQLGLRVLLPLRLDQQMQVVTYVL